MGLRVPGYPTLRWDDTMMTDTDTDINTDTDTLIWVSSIPDTMMPDTDTRYFFI